MLLPVAMVAWPQLPAPSDDSLLLFTVHFRVWKPQTLLWVDVGMSGSCYNVIPGPLLSLCIMSNSEIISSTEPCIIINRE